MKILRGHGAKGRWNDVELEAFGNPIVLIDNGRQNMSQAWTYTSCSNYVWWCNIDKKWPLVQHEIHCMNNSIAFMSCLDAKMEELMLEVYTTMTGSPIFAKN